MTLRARIREIRMFYKSRPLFDRVLAHPRAALGLPFGVGGEFEARNGVRFRLPARHWRLLPTFCRLAEIGAEPAIEGSEKRIRIDGLELRSPLHTKAEGQYLREVFREDIYRIGERQLSGRVVVDIGAHVGDTSLAFARHGARVYAFEPSLALCDYAKRNIAANPTPGSVTLFSVGLSDRAFEETIPGEHLVFVEGVSFVIANVPPNVELLKMDCEGCEYHLLAAPQFLDHLRPKAIALEYHRGGEPIATILESRGYEVEWDPKVEPVGMLFARRADA